MARNTFRSCGCVTSDWHLGNTDAEMGRSTHQSRPSPLEVDAPVRPRGLRRQWVRPSLRLTTTKSLLLALRPTRASSATGGGVW